MTNHPAPTPPEADVQAAKTIKCHLCGNDVEQWPCSATGNEHRPAPEPTDQERTACTPSPDCLCRYECEFAPGPTDQTREQIAAWLRSHEASVVVTDALTQREVFMLRPKVREVLSEAARALAVHVSPETAEERIAKVELIHAPRLIHPLNDDGSLDETQVLRTYCEECTPDDSVSMIEDAEWTEDLPIVEHPCRTVTFLRAGGR